MRKYIYISFLAAVLLAFLLPFQFLLNFAHDDSFFYIKTASNFSKGLGSTFDGMNLTNGYHPLYFIFLVILFFIPNLLFKSSPEFLYRLVVIFHLIMIIGVQFFIIKAFKNIYKNDVKKTGLILLFTLFSSFIFIRDFGLESHLACLIISIFLYIKSKELITTGENNILLKSLLIIGLFLTRTDYIFSFIPILLIIDFYLSSSRKSYILTSLTLLFVTVITYYSLNYLLFGSLDTVSGKLLNGFPSINLKSNICTLLIDPAKLYNQFARIVFVLISFILFVFSYLKTRIKNNITSKFNLIIFGLGAGSVIFTLIHLTYNMYSIREWYMTLPVFLSIIMITVLLFDKKIILNISLILSLILLIYVFYGSRINNLKYVSGYEYAKSLNTVVKENESIYQVDYCGVVGFFSERSVVEGDGLINSFEYLDYLRKGKVDDYISKHNIKYYSTYSIKNLLSDSIYIDDNFSDKINGKVFNFPKSSLVMEQQFKWNHIAFDLEGKWYLFKFK
ncbi:MAG: hypothetical protein NTU73_00520 [Ignavibacteriae bacterium]|nr:hypothetical protein [Ignavibacteriota bacterium]